MTELANWSFGVLGNLAADGVIFCAGWLLSKYRERRNVSQANEAAILKFNADAKSNNSPVTLSQTNGVITYNTPDGWVSGVTVYDAQTGKKY